LRGLCQLIQFHSLSDSICEFLRGFHTNISRNKQFLKLIPSFLAHRTPVKNMSYFAKPGFLSSLYPVLKQCNLPQIAGFKYDITIITVLLTIIFYWEGATVAAL